MKYSICGQTFTETSTYYLACGYSIEKMLEILEGQQLSPKTLTKAIDFYQTKIHAGAWFELKKIGYKYYLYGRLRDGTVKRSHYIGRI